jgi:hypothetical protein
MPMGTMDLADEMPEHFLRHLKVGDHAVLHGTHGVDALRSPPEHHLRLFADSHDFVEPGLVSPESDH